MLIPAGGFTTFEKCRYTKTSKDGENLYNKMGLYKSIAKVHI